jgi:hypothetical protein
MGDTLEHTAIVVADVKTRKADVLEQPSIPLGRGIVIATSPISDTAYLPLREENVISEAFWEISGGRARF